MLAGSPQPPPGGVQAPGDGGRGGEHMASRGFSGRSETVGLGDGAGTSRPGLRPAARGRERGSSSEAE